MDDQGLRKLTSSVTEERISVIIPTFNRIELVKAAVHSVVLQTWPEVEIVVVDDGSTDGTLDALRVTNTRSGPFERDLRLIYQSNGGVATARNHGLREATGDLILFLDSDDLLDRDALSQMVKAMRSESADMALIPIRSIRLDRSPARDNGSGTPFFEYASRRSHWFTHSALYRRTLVDRAGPFCERLNRGEEAEFHWRIARLTDRVVQLDQCLGSRRHHHFGHLSLGLDLADFARTILDAVVSNDRWLDENGFDHLPFGWRDWLTLMVVGTRLGGAADWHNRDLAALLIRRKLPRFHPGALLSRGHFRPQSAFYYTMSLAAIDAGRWLKHSVLRRPAMPRSAAHPPR